MIGTKIVQLESCSFKQMLSVLKNLVLLFNPWWPGFIISGMHLGRCFYNSHWTMSLLRSRHKGKFIRKSVMFPDHLFYYYYFNYVFLIYILPYFSFITRKKKIIYLFSWLVQLSTRSDSCDVLNKLRKHMSQSTFQAIQLPDTCKTEVSHASICIHTLNTPLSY